MSIYIWNIVMVLIETQNNCLGEKKDCMTIVFIFFFFFAAFLPVCYYLLIFK